MTRLFTIGHSTRSTGELFELLHANEVRVLADVRTVPGSRRHPQFGREALATEVERAGVRYVHLPRLGGLRKPRPDSVNLGWRNASFRGYADYMATDEFERGLDDLLTLAGEAQTALMCAEAVPWRCHRSLLADALVVRGAAVEHILGHRAPQPHQLTSFAQVEGHQVTYSTADASREQPRLI